MEENKMIAPTISCKYILRNTNEEVEVIASNLIENGARNEGDWVTYIDSNGNEHIKESLNIQLDFKPCDDMSSMFGKVFNSYNTKFPSIKNTRLYDTVKTLVLDKNYNITDAIKFAKEIVESVDDYDNED